MFHFEKFAVISDTHYDSPSFPEEEKNRLTKEFFKNIRKRNIKTIVHMGDVFQSADRKNYAFFEEIQDERVYMLAGNHDYAMDGSFTDFHPKVISISENTVMDGCQFLPAEGFGKALHTPSWQTLIAEEEEVKYRFAHASNEQGVFCGHFHNRRGSRFGSAWAYDIGQSKTPKGFHVIKQGEIEFVELHTKYWLDYTSVLPKHILDLGNQDILEVSEENLKLRLKIYLGWDEGYEEKTLDAITESIRYWRSAPKSEQEKIGALWKEMKSIN